MSAEQEPELDLYWYAFHYRNAQVMQANVAWENLQAYVAELERSARAEGFRVGRSLPVDAKPKTP